MKVIKIENESITFDDGTKLFGNHESDCCESHYYLSFNGFELKDFDGLEFDLSNDSFFEKVNGFGIRLIAKNGQKISVPSYGHNNGYYSNDLTLIVINDQKNIKKEFNITECQKISE